MTINHEKKLIFIHIPKNAGTSITKAMGSENICIDGTIEDYKKNYVDYWNQYKKFTVVRDPIDRFISAYKFARMNESTWFSITGRDDLDKHPHYNICNSVDINGYVSYLYENPQEFNIWTYNQTYFLTNKERKTEIDYCLRYENLNQDLKSIGIHNIERNNVSKIKIEDEHLLKLSKKSKKILHEIYYIDYKNFLYSM